MGYEKYMLYIVIKYIIFFLTRHCIALPLTTFWMNVAHSSCSFCLLFHTPDLRGVTGIAGCLYLRFISRGIVSTGLTSNRIAFKSAWSCLSFSSVHLVSRIQMSAGLDWYFVTFDFSILGNQLSVLSSSSSSPE